MAAGARVSVAPGARVVLGAARRSARAPGSTPSAARSASARERGSGERAVVVSHAGVEIGPRAVIGDWAAVEGAAPTYRDSERPVREQPLLRAPVTIGAGAVVGPHAVVGPGVAVPAGAEVAPYAVLQ